MSEKLALFDFDGTLTHKDSLLDFIQFAVGKPRTLIGGIKLLPTFLYYALGMISNNKAKERVFRHFFSGFSYIEMQALGERYAFERLPKILRKVGLEKLKWHINKNHRVIIVSASAELWLAPWTNLLRIELIATQLEVIDHTVTGRYQGKNCHGEEKVSRIKAVCKLEEYDEIFAYGDTNSDKAMLALANKAFYKAFHH